MLTPKLSGIFDCRKFDQSGKIEHAQRPMLADTDNVTFGALIPIDQVADCFKQGGVLDEFAVARASKRERAAAEQEGREPVADVVGVRFKIGQNCKWFDKYAKAITRPTNTELEACRYQVQIDFTRKEKNPNAPLQPSGYWANAIMICPIEENPFAGQAFEQADEPEPEPEQPATQEPADDLPFD